MQKPFGFSRSLRCASLALALLCSAAPAALAQGSATGPDRPYGYLDRSGLSELVFWQAINGAVVGGQLGYVLFGGMLKERCADRVGSGLAEEEAPLSSSCQSAIGRAAGVQLLGLATGIAAPLLLTRGRPATTSSAVMINRATLIGAMHGYIIPFAAGLTPFDTDRPEYVVEMTESRWLAGLTAAGDLAGLATGVYLGRRSHLPLGTLSLLGTLHLTVFTAGMLVGTSFPRDVSQGDMRLISATSLALADVAMAVGLVYADRIDIGRNRVFWLDTGALLGALAGSALGAIIAGDESRVISITSTVGLGAGMVLAYWATDGSERWRRRFEPVPGVAVDLEAPALRIEPRAGSGGGTLAVSIDVLRGRY